MGGRRLSFFEYYLSVVSGILPEGSVQCELLMFVVARDVQVGVAFPSSEYGT